MAAYFKELSKYPFWLFTILLVIVVAADTLISRLWSVIYYGFMHGNAALWSWGSPGLYEGGLSPNAAINSLWHELWFAEPIAFILAAFLLWKYRTRKTKLLPWVLAGALSLIGIFMTFANHHPLPVTADNPYPANSNLAELLHQGPTIPVYTVPFNRMFGGDPALESEFPDFLLSQVPYVFVLAAGYLISNRRHATMRDINNS